MRAHIRQHVQSMGGRPELTLGVELASLIGMAAHLYEAIGDHFLGATGLSPARWRLLFRLLAEERRGNAVGVTPTELSRGENVSKNTVSAHLRGLEEQGLIRRALDPADRRVFRIQPTEKARHLVESSAPQRLAHLNSLLADLTPAQQAQLADLVEALCGSLLAHGSLPEAGLAEKDGGECSH